MKLYELTCIKKLNSLSVSDLIMYFIDNSKYMFAGNGAQAYVFIHPNNKEVIRFWIYDDAYEHFIKYIKTHSDNEFLPKIHKGINQLKFKNHIIKYVRIEKLKPLTNSNMVYGVNFKKLISVIHKSIEKRGITKAVNDYDNGKFKNELALIIDMLSVSDNPDINSIIQFYDTYFDILKTSNSKILPDLHSNNVMLRGNVPVITDPLNDTESSWLTLDKLSKKHETIHTV